MIIRKLPDDIEAFKKAAEKSPTGVPVKKKVKPFNSNKVRSTEDDLFEMRERDPPPPSYDIHFLQHASQAITGGDSGGSDITRSSRSKYFSNGQQNP